MLDLADALLELIDALSGVVCIAVIVRCTEVAPLKAIDGAKVTLASMAEATLVEEVLGAVAVPDLDALCGKEFGVCRAVDEPEELLYDAAEEGSLCGEKREGAVCEGEAEVGRGEDGDGAGPCAVWADIACVEDRTDEVEVLELVVGTR